MVEVTGDTDGTVEFDCAILNAGRPGAVKCSTQCANCKVTYVENNQPDSIDTRSDTRSEIVTEEESTMTEPDWVIHKIGVRMSPRAKRQTQKWLVLHLVVAGLNFWSAWRNWRLLQQVNAYEKYAEDENDTPHWNLETGAGIDRFGENERHAEMTVPDDTDDTDESEDME